ncbi:MAG: bifunctional oligoribonuclease/PAP phosphatase NrnA [Clostridiales bacterium]|nr:bifunctional oligoribonuclease/PAP phosphatase NrnA [Clostridiales bacterium]
MFQELLNKIIQASNIALFPHKNPDGDALGSTFAFKEILESLGKRAFVVFEDDEMSPILNSVVGSENNIPCDDYDLFVAIDSANTDRISKKSDLFFSKGVESTIVIDHHFHSNTKFGGLNFVKDAPACGEVMYNIAQEWGVSITPSMATNMYLAIVFDTINFSISNVTPSTLIAGAELLKLGADMDKVQLQFKLKSPSQIRLRNVLFENSTIKDGLAHTYCTLNELDISGATAGDCEGLVNEFAYIQGIKVAMLFRKLHDGEFKVSLRSNSDKFDVNAFAAIFGGGGHVRAAGCTILDVDFFETMAKFVDGARVWLDNDGDLSKVNGL